MRSGDFHGLTSVQPLFDFKEKMRVEGKTKRAFTRF